MFDSRDVEAYRKNGERIMHWLPAEKKAELATVEIVMPDNSRVTGIAETGIKQLKVGDTIQFERFGFCRLDAVEPGKHVFWYCHR